MQLFTRRFIKDLIIIAILGTLLYALVHNPITHPVPQEVKGLWSIQLMQQPLVFGIAGHNFLTLRNENNAIVGELHGLATDNKTGEWKYIGNKDTDKLKVWYFKSPHDYITQKNYSGVVLYKGTKESTVNIWNHGVTCKDSINQQERMYPPYGVTMRGDTENSNSVAYTLVLCMGLDAEHLGLITPGWGKNLLQTYKK